MKTSRNLITLASTILLLAATATTQAQLTVLHHFGSSIGDGFHPFGSLTMDGSTLYGMTSRGGDDYAGTIFKINTDGTGYTILHSFGTAPGDGALPYGSLTRNGSTLYGMTSAGGTGGNGVIFQMNTNGTGYTVLYDFDGGGNGASPMGALTLYASTLYGLASQEPYCNGCGTMFQISTNGTGFTVLHWFGGSSDGNTPEGSLVWCGAGVGLMGLAAFGSDYNNGAVFNTWIDGSQYASVHIGEYSLEEGVNGFSIFGAAPLGSPTWDVQTLRLYFTTGEGGAGGYGTILSFDGNDWEVLHSFAGGPNDGSSPSGSLTLSNSVLYGTTAYGGSSDSGVVFRVNTDGSGYTNLHSFAGGPSDGAWPQGDVTLSGSTLYGMTQQGGSNNNGVIFAFTMARPMTVTKLQAKVNFNPSKSDVDTCNLTATLESRPGFSVSNQSVMVDIGDAQAFFTLNAQGRSATKTNACKFSYAKKTQLWTVTASLKNGSWAVPWADYGCTNATTPKTGLIVTLPVTVTVGDWTFTTEKSLLYKATANNSGTAK
ncbi:MAG TPA: choice-of-anchor tandem repeat GloVer-containing protein [Verrucomicrobiae bacterium]|nr:choice-of-anchor tandem repeat GloVer-containing protein [Verrucomicrobiae bacterium]